MKRTTAIAATLLAAGLAATPALAARYGSVTLRAGETQQIEIMAAAQEMYVCNDLLSAGQVAIVVGGNQHILPPGLCTDTVIGDRILATNEGNGPSMLSYQFSPGSHGLGRFQP